jgi:FlaA1/EpsC-like NDP-sugar epimerase
MHAPDTTHGLDDLWRQLTGLPLAAPRIPHDALAGRRVLLTGAGGSIGSALARSIAAAKPAQLLLLDSNEHSLYQIDRELAALPRTASSHPAILGSVTDRSLLEDLFHCHRPEIVLHAAAFKHVPLMEQNPFAALANNALGTYILAQAAAHHGAEHMVLVSTDKAVDPHSLMGASKRIAELVVLSLGAASGTRLSAVRLCNVLGSQGSVVPLFLDQIARGVPLTITDPEARRYFVPLEQAVEALLDALATPALPGSLFVPQLAPPIRILDLARQLLDLARDLSGRHGGRDSVSGGITFTGLRPGDKLEESLLSSREQWFPSAHAAAQSGLRGLSSPHPTAAELTVALRGLEDAVERRDLADTLRVVQDLVPEYIPSSQLTLFVQHAEEACA